MKKLKNNAKKRDARKVIEDLFIKNKKNFHQDSYIFFHERLYCMKNIYNGKKCDAQKVSKNIFFIIYKK